MQRNRTVVWGRQVLVALTIVTASVIVVGQGITIPNTFVNGTVADAPQVNANFTALAANALNRNGGTMLGTLNSQSILPTSDNTYDLGSATFALRDAYVKRNTILNTVTYTWPGSQGVAGSLLQNNGSGTLSWTVGGWTVNTTTLTGTQNDVAPGSSGNTVLRCNNATLLTITGFSGGNDGQHVLVVSIGAGQVDLPHQSASSTAGSRFINVATSGNTSLAPGVGVAEYVYDATTARWRLINHEQGAWITPTYAAGNYTASTGTWTVDSGDVTTQAYWLKERSLSVAVFLVTTSVSATPATLIVSNAAWGGFTIAKTTLNPLVYNDNAAGNTAGFVQVSAAGTTLPISKLNGSFSISVNATNVFGQTVFEVQ